MKLKGRHAVLATGLVAGMVVIYTVPTQLAGDWFLYVWALLSTLLLIIYGLRAPSRRTWRHTDVGRALMYQTASMALIGTQASIAVTWPSYPLRLDVRQAMFLLLILASLNMLLAVTRIQADMRRQMIRQQREREWYSYAPDSPEDL